MRKVIKNKQKMKNTMFVIFGVYSLVLLGITNLNPLYAQENGILLDSVIETVVGEEVSNINETNDTNTSDVQEGEGSDIQEGESNEGGEVGDGVEGEEAVVGEEGNNVEENGVENGDEENEEVSEEATESEEVTKGEEEGVEGEEGNTEEATNTDDNKVDEHNNEEESNVVEEGQQDSNVQENSNEQASSDEQVNTDEQLNSNVTTTSGEGSSSGGSSSGKSEEKEKEVKEEVTEVVEQVETNNEDVNEIVNEENSNEENNNSNVSEQVEQQPVEQEKTELEMAWETLNEEEIVDEYTYNGVTVSVKAPVGSFPKDVKLVITPMEGEQLDEAQKKVSNKDMTVFDIAFMYTFKDGSRVELEPKEGKKVQVSFNYEKNEKLNNAAKKGQRLKVYHIGEEAEEMRIDTNERGELTVNVDKFSPYGIALTKGGEGGGTTATLLSGPSFNAKIKSLAKGSSVSYSTSDTLIQKIERSSVPASAGVSTGLISSYNSPVDVVAWYDSGTIYYYTEAKEIYMNEESSYMFYYISQLTNIDLSSWNTSKVTSMSYMFYYCSSLKTVYASSGFNSNNVSSSYSNNVFGGDTNIIGGNGTKYNSSYTNKTYARVDIASQSGYFTDKTEKIRVKFKVGDAVYSDTVVNYGDHITAPEGLDVSGWYYKGMVEEFNFETDTIKEYTELYAKGGTTASLLPGQSFNAKIKSLAKGSSISYSTTDTLIQKIERSSTPAPAGVNTGLISSDISPVEIVAWYDNGTIYYYTEADEIYMNPNSDSMFGYMRSLTSLDISSWDASKVTNMSYMFYYCGNLTSLDLSSWNTSNVTNMHHIFGYCSSLTDLDLSSWDTSSVTNMEAMFYYCYSLTDLDLSSWDTSNVTQMNAMFYNCSNLRSLDLSSWNTSNVTNMGSMFYYCSSLRSLDLSSWNTSNVTSMSYMFNNCSNLTSIDLSGWDTSKVTDMGYMFNDCSNLTSIDLSSWNTSNVTDMQNMFSYCSKLDTIYATGDFDMSKVTNHSSMFYGTPRIVGGNGTRYDSSYTNGTYAKIDNQTQSGYFTDPNEITVKFFIDGEEYDSRSFVYGSRLPQNLEIEGLKGWYYKGENFSFGESVIKGYMELCAVFSNGGILYKDGKIVVVNGNKTISLSDKNVGATRSATGVKELYNLLYDCQFNGDGCEEYVYDEVSDILGKNVESWIDVYNIIKHTYGNFYFWGNNSFATYEDFDNGDAEVNGSLETDSETGEGNVVLYDEGWNEINPESDLAREGFRPLDVYDKETGWEKLGSTNPCDVNKGEYLPTREDWEELMQLWGSINGINSIDYTFRSSFSNDMLIPDIWYNVYIPYGENSFSSNYNKVDYEFMENVYNMPLSYGAKLFLARDEIGGNGSSYENLKLYRNFYSDYYDAYYSSFSDGYGLGQVRCFMHPEFSVTFKSDNQNINNLNVREGNKITKPDNPQKQGYTFIGWYTSAGYEWNFDEDIVEDDMILYAKWTENQKSEGNSGGYSGGGGRGGGGNKITKTDTTKNEHNVANATDENLTTQNETKGNDEFNVNSQTYASVVPQTVVPELDVKKYNATYTPEQNTAYQFSYKNGITSKSSIKEAKMNTSLTRIQMAKMLSNYAINVLYQEPDVSRGVIKFRDVTNKMNAEYDNGVTLAYQLGIMGINMENNEFRPNDEVTRAEFATALSRMLYKTEDGKGKVKYYEPHISKLYNEGVISDTNPKIKELRGYVMTMLMRTVK